MSIVCKSVSLKQHHPCSKKRRPHENDTIFAAKLDLCKVLISEKPGVHAPIDSLHVQKLLLQNHVAFRDDDHLQGQHQAPKQIIPPLLFYASALRETFPRPSTLRAETTAHVAPDPGNLYNLQIGSQFTDIK